MVGIGTGSDRARCRVSGDWGGCARRRVLSLVGARAQAKSESHLEQLVRLVQHHRPQVGAQAACRIVPGAPVA